MKQYIFLRALPLFLLLLCIGTMISASTLRAYAAEEDYQHVFDKAGLLSTSEADEIEKLCIDYGTDAEVEIMVLTHNDPKAIYAEDYIEDFEDQLPVGDRVYLLIDMYNRVVFIEGYGTAETYIHSKRGDAIIDQITPYLSEGDYKQAITIFINEAAAYMKDDSELNYDHDYSAGKPQSSNPNGPYYSETLPSNYYGNSGGAAAKSILTNVWFQLIAAVIIGIVTVSVMAYHSGGRMTAGSSTYMDAGQSGLIGRRDDYIRTHVTRVRKPKEDNNNHNHHAGGGFNTGGFQGGVSSGGRSHSSSGGKF